MSSLKGSFLIATPGLMDPNFNRTVVYMVEHNDDGAFGLVLTRPGTFTLWDVCQKIFEDAEELPGKDGLSTVSVFSGGPVQESGVFYLHTDVEPDAAPVLKSGITMGSQVEDLHRVLTDLNGEFKRFRIFFGYSGWAPGQLEQELKNGGWLVRPATLGQVFDLDPEHLWSQLVQSFGGDLGILGLMPSDPDLN